MKSAVVPTFPNSFLPVYICMLHECGRYFPSREGDRFYSGGRASRSRSKAKHLSFYTRPPPEFLALKQESRILGHSSNPVCGFSMMEQVRLCAVWLMENWDIITPHARGIIGMPRSRGHGV